MIDVSLLFCDGMTVRSVGTKYSTNVVKYPSGTDEFGNTTYMDPGRGGGPRPWLNVVVDTAFTSANSTATLKVCLFAGTTSTASSMTQVFDSAPIKNTTANLQAGDTIWSGALPANLTAQDHLALAFVVGTTAFTSGAVNAFVNLDPQIEV